MAAAGCAQADAGEATQNGSFQTRQVGWFTNRPAHAARQAGRATRETDMSKTRLLTSVATLGVGAALALGPAAAAAQEIVGLITKTNTNPFFVKMKEGAEAKAGELGIELRSYAGKYDGDNQGQVEAIESLIAAGAKGILITPSDSAAIVPTVERARD